MNPRLRNILICGQLVVLIMIAVYIIIEFTDKTEISSLVVKSIEQEIPTEDLLGIEENEGEVETYPGELIPEKNEGIKVTPILFSSIYYANLGNPITAVVDSKNYTFNLLGTKKYLTAEIDINDRWYLNLKMQDRIYIDNGVIFSLLDVDKKNIIFRLEKNLNKTYLKGNVSITINDISLDIKENNTAETTKVYYSIKNNWGDITPELKISFSGKEKIISFDELKANALITKETKLFFDHFDIYNTHTLRIDLIDENGFILASAAKSFNIVEDEEFKGDYKLVDISEFTEYQRINEFIGVKGTIDYEIIGEDDSGWGFGNMYIIKDNYSIKIDECESKDQVFNICDINSLLKEGQKYLIIGKWTLGKWTVPGFRIWDYEEIIY